MTEKKTKKMLIGVPHYSDIPPKYVISIMNMALYLVQELGWSVNNMYSEGSIISQQRNKIAKTAAEEKYDYLFFPDADTKFAPQEIKKLLDVDKEVVGGLYYARRPRHRPIVFKKFDGLHYVGMTQYDLDQKDEGPFSCVAVGTGFMLIKGSLLQEMHDEDFIKEHGHPFNFWQLPNGIQMGEDLSFCYRVKEIMGREIWCVPDVFVEHMSNIYVTKETHLATLQKDVHYCNSIGGWMFVKELNWLFKAARGMETICEIGTWKGRATHALCSGIKPGGVVHTVDHFKGSTGEAEQHWQAHTDEFDVKQMFMDNVGDRFSNCVLHEMSSLEYAEHCKKNGIMFDMVFLDGTHVYEEFMEDLIAFYPLTKKLISGHDFEMFPGVTRAVEEFFESRINTHETIWWKEIGK